MRMALPVFVLAGVLTVTAGVPGATALPPALAVDLQAQVVAPPPVEAGVRRSRLVSVNTSTLPARPAGPVRPASQPDLTLALFPDVTVVAAFDRFDLAGSAVVWVGRVRGDDRSSVTLVYGDTWLTASINMASGTYVIRPAPEDVRRQLDPTAGPAHVVLEIDQALLPSEGPPVPVVLPGAPAAERPLVDSADEIDLLVVYTEAARARQGGTTAAIEQWIALGASETNTSYQSAGIQQRVRVVHSALVTYREPNELNVTLAELRNGSGTGLEDVAALRDAVGADLVMLMVQAAVPNYCGIAYLMSTVSTTFAPSGYSVVHSTCVSPSLTFAHELGHNMGAHHDWYVTSAIRPFPHAHGYVNPAAGQRWRTVMAYNDHCADQGFSCRRLPTWSNPDQRVVVQCSGTSGFPCEPRLWRMPSAALGVPAGTRSPCPLETIGDTDCDADNRLTLNTTALTVANLRPRPAPEAAIR